MIAEAAAVALGGAGGAVVRGAFVRMAGPEDRLGWPPAGPALATILANTLGCVLVGSWLIHGGRALATLGLEWTTVLEVAVTGGFCGGLSTFSSLCADTLRLARAHGPAAPAVYLASTIVLGLAGFALGRGGAPL